MHPGTELVVYSASRLASAVVSMSIFAILAGRLPAGQAESVFFLLFVIGFSVAMLRSYCMLCANLVGDLTRHEGMRRIARCALSYGRLMPFAWVALTFVLGFQALPLWACPLMALFVLLAGYDSDLTRAVLRRSAVYPVLTLVGNLTSLGLLLGFDQLGLPGVIVSILTIWMPSAFFSATRWLIERNFAIRHGVNRRPLSQAVFFRPLLVTSLEGLILNAPFLGGTGAITSGAAGYDLAIAVRVFSSSQPLFPLIMHWGVSGKLAQLGRAIQVKEEILYAVSLLFTGLVASLVFVALFGVISHQRITVVQYLMFAVLLSGYCVYLSQTRFSAMCLSLREVWGLYVVCLLSYFLTLSALRAYIAPAWTVALLQGLSLLFAGLAIHAMARQIKVNRLITGVGGV